MITTGGMLSTACEVANTLRNAEGMGARVLSMHTVKPLDEAAILQAAGGTGVIFTLEEHSINGNLGGAVAEVIAEANVERVKFRRIGLPPSIISYIGSQDYIRGKIGLSAEKVLATVLSYVGR